MTPHPATVGAPAHGFTNPADLIRDRDELADLHAMAAAAGFVGPLRDTLAHLIARDKRTEMSSMALGMVRNDLDVINESLATR